MERVFDVSYVMEQLNAPRLKPKLITLDEGINVKYNDTLRVFRKHYHKKGIIKCDVCGIEGDIFVLNYDTKTNTNYITLINDKHNIPMTKDHVNPLCNGASIGGLYNQVPMCKKCNNIWKSKFDEQLKRRM